MWNCIFNINLPEQFWKENVFHWQVWVQGSAPDFCALTQRSLVTFPMLWFQRLGKPTMDSVTLVALHFSLRLLAGCTSQQQCNISALSTDVAPLLIPADGPHGDGCLWFLCGAARGNLGGSLPVWVKIFHAPFFLQEWLAEECIWHRKADEAFAFPAEKKGILKISHAAQVELAGPDFAKRPLLLGVSVTMCLPI